MRHFSLLIISLTSLFICSVGTALSEKLNLADTYAMFSLIGVLSIGGCIISFFYGMQQYNKENSAKCKITSKGKLEKEND